MKKMATIWLGLMLLASVALATSSSSFASLSLSCSGGSPGNVNFAVTVTNIDSLVLTGITVTLQQGVFVGTIPSLGPGQSQTLTGSTSAPSNGILGPAILSASAGGVFAVAIQSNLATCVAAVTTPAPRPLITGTKTCTATVSNGQILVCWTATLTNAGNVPFSSITVTENTGTGLSPQSAQALPVGASITLSSCYTPSNQNALSFSDSVSVFAVSNAGVTSSFGPFTATCSRPSTVTTTPPRVVNIAVTKTCQAVNQNGVITVFWEAQIVNTGNVGFTSITVTENQGLLAPQSAQALPVGATIRISGSYNPSNPSASSFSDTVTVIAIAQGESTPRQFSGSATCPAPSGVTTAPPSNANLEITKRCSARRVGNHVLVDFVINIRNTGQVRFSTITVIDKETNTNAAPATFIISSGLELGASTQVTGTYRPSNSNALVFSDTVTVFATPRGSSSTITFPSVTAVCGIN